MEQNLLDRMLDSYQQSATPLTITLQNGIRIHGAIGKFDSYVIMMKNDKNDIVYRHAISFLAPTEERSSQKDSLQPATAGRDDSRHKNGRPASAPQRQKPERRRRQDHDNPKESRTDGDICINSSMKDGLLKWMEVQKASKI